MFDQRDGHCDKTCCQKSSVFSTHPDWLITVCHCSHLGMGGITYFVPSKIKLPVKIMFVLVEGSPNFSLLYPRDGADWRRGNHSPWPAARVWWIPQRPGRGAHWHLKAPGWLSQGETESLTSIFWLELAPWSLQCPWITAIPLDYCITLELLKAFWIIERCLDHSCWNFPDPESLKSLLLTLVTWKSVYHCWNCLEYDRCFNLLLFIRKSVVQEIQLGKAFGWKWEGMWTL